MGAPGCALLPSRAGTTSTHVLPCTQVIAALEAGRAAEHLVPGTRIRAGYWSIAVPPAYSDPRWVLLRRKRALDCHPQFRAFVLANGDDHLG
jgi:hypothetical protein